MPRKKPRTRTLRGGAIVRLVADRKKTLSIIDLDPEIRHLATQVLDAVATNVETWELDRSDLPSLPNKPAFSLLANGHAYSNIPLPKAQRHRFGGAYQKRKRWPGTGMVAWAHYVAQVSDVIFELTNPAANPSPGRAAMGLSLCRVVRETPPSDFVWLTHKTRMYQDGVDAPIWAHGGRDQAELESILGTERPGTPAPAVDHQAPVPP